MSCPFCNPWRARIEAIRADQQDDSDGPVVVMRSRVASMRAWAESRILHCREQEKKFGDAWVHRDRHHHGPPQALVEAWTERRALQAVLETLDAEDSVATVRADQHKRSDDEP